MTVYKDSESKYGYKSFERIDGWIIRNLCENGNCFISKKQMKYIGGELALKRFFKRESNYNIKEYENGFIVTSKVDMEAK